ncbi:hypothetical protein SAMN02745115_00266 [[Eubacterium] yurii]|jgi:hypothetical protein|nr:hypothetical protein SAMN02745115_00266 [[Eubacterium] yurii]
MKNCQKILKDLISIYSQLYEHKQILSCNKLFKYDVESVEKLSEYFLNNSLSDNTKNNIKQKNKNSKNVLSGITTREELKIFYYENLTYDRNDDKKRESIVKKYTKSDFQEMFRILFATETNETKDKIFSDIQYFYDSLERSKRI